MCGQCPDCADHAREKFLAVLWVRWRVLWIVGVALLHHVGNATHGLLEQAEFLKWVDGFLLPAFGRVEGLVNWVVGGSGCWSWWSLPRYAQHRMRIRVVDVVSGNGRVFPECASV